MKSSRILVLFLGLAGVCLTAGPLGAGAVQGSFTLPSETQWGVAVLPAGEYTFTLDRSTLEGHILVRRGTEGVALVLAQGMFPTGSSGSSSMLIVGGRVRSLHLAPLGLTYNYQIHPQRSETLTGISAVRTVTVSLVKK